MDLEIRFKKHRGGAVSLSCRRADESVTWQRQDGIHASFFPIHDLTHYAVETTLGARRGFYGLICEGWDIGDFDKPWPKGPLPAEARRIELLVGFLDAERASGEPMPAAKIGEFSENFAATHGRDASHESERIDIDDAELGRIRRRRNDLMSRWSAVPDNGELVLPFDRGLVDSANERADADR